MYVVPSSNFLCSSSFSLPILRKRTYIYTFKIKSVQKLFSIRSVESEYSTHPVLSNHQLATDTNMNIHADDALMGAPRNAD